jgi:hypothetical protein
VRFLLDANVLIALSDLDHASHERATIWFENTGGKFATCPITQGAFIRFLFRTRAGTTIGQAKRLLAEIAEMPGHEFWPDSISLPELPERGIAGYRQVTDAYLVALARHNRGKLATLDRSLAALHGDDAVLVP